MDRHHCEPLPPSVLEAKLDVLADQIAALRADNTQQFETLQQAHSRPESLLCIQSIANYLGVSKRTIETMVAAGELPPPLWIRGQRRWHPDTIAAFLRSREVTGR